MVTNRLIKLSEVKHLTSLSRSRIYFLIKENNFPHPIKIGERRVAWVKNAVSAWIEKKIQETNQETNQEQECVEEAF